jgi:lactobin A/cerein 7B family class IIb bacteriocin
MKNLNLNVYGVEEMDDMQMAEINGGILPILACIAIAAICYYCSDHSAR